MPVMVSVCITASTERGQMIAPIWRGWAPQATAGDYQRHYETEVSRHLQGAEGFCGARLLRCDDGQEVIFTSVAFFTTIDAVHGFAGEDYEQAVVEEAARQALTPVGRKGFASRRVRRLARSLVTLHLIAASGCSPNAAMHKYTVRGLPAEPGNRECHEPAAPRALVDRVPTRLGIAVD